MYVTSTVKDDYASVLFDLALTTSVADEFPSSYIEIEIPTRFSLFGDSNLY